MVKQIILAILLLAFISKGCIPYKDFKHFTFYEKEKKRMITNLKMRGLYYYIDSVKRFSPELPDSYLNCFMLFEDGTFLDLHSRSNFYGIDSTLKSEIKWLNDDTVNGKSFSSWMKYNSLKSWGAYRIKNDTIRIQSFSQRRPWEYFIYERTGIITNDTTIIFYNVLKYTTNEKWEEVDKIYHFYPLNKKPDSTNLFTTNKRIARKLDRLEEKRKRKKINVRSKQLK